MRRFLFEVKKDPLIFGTKELSYDNQEMVSWESWVFFLYDTCLWHREGQIWVVHRDQSWKARLWGKKSHKEVDNEGSRVRDERLFWIKRMLSCNWNINLRIERSQFALNHWLRTTSFFAHMTEGHQEVRQRLNHTLYKFLSESVMKTTVAEKSISKQRCSFLAEQTENLNLSWYVTFISEKNSKKRDLPQTCQW